MMKENEEKLSIKEGTPWKNAAKFNTWEKAHQKRLALTQEWKKNDDAHMQVKVKKLTSGFVVKVRVDPTAKKLNSSKKSKKKVRNKK
jgi:hypothetical protein